FKGVKCAALAPDARFALLARRNQPFAEIDLGGGKETGRWKEAADLPVSLAIAPDGSRVLEGTERGEARLWDVASGKGLHTFPGHQRRVRAVAFSPDGRRALTGSDDQTVRLWDLEGKKELACFTGHTGAVQAVAFSPDGRRAASGSADYTVRLWRLPPATPIAAPPAGVAPEDKGFVPLFNGKDLAGWNINEGGNMAVWGAENGVLYANGRGGGWLMTEKEYDDFELRLDFKLPEKGNSGVAL